MKKILLICFLVVLAMYAIVYKDYIVYFFKLLKGEVKHNNRLYNLKNKNKKKRLLRRSDIKNYVRCSIGSLQKINHPYGKKYKLDPYLRQKLQYSRLDDKSVKELYQSICEHMNIDNTDITFGIRRTSSRTKTTIAGSYGYKDKDIVVEISTYTTIDQLISTISHECTHHIFHTNNLELKKVEKNENLTDVSAIILGFGDYFCKAYKDRSRIIYEGEFLELVDRQKLGYIGYKDVKLVMKYAKRLKNKVVEIPKEM